MVESRASNPWERLDRYGECGLKPQPLWEKIRILVVLLFIVPIKILGSLGCLVSFYVVTKLSVVLFPESVRTDWVAALGKIHCRMCLLFIGFIKVRWVDLSPDRRSDRDGYVGIVSNHCSWCDILVHMSHFFPAFVARSKTEHTRFVGAISKAMGCLYVERATTTTSDQLSPRSRQGVSNLVKARMQRVAHGHTHARNERPLLLFPEATTTNGQFLLPFKSGAFLAGEPLQPVILQYGARRFSPSWESIVATRHIFLLLCNVFHTVTCYMLPVYYPSEAEKKDPILYANNVRKAMLKASGLRPSNETYIDKVKFNDALKKKYGYYKPGFPTRPGVEE